MEFSEICEAAAVLSFALGYSGYAKREVVLTDASKGLSARAESEYAPAAESQSHHATHDLFPA